VNFNQVVLLSFLFLLVACKARDFNAGEVASTKSSDVPISYDTAASIGIILLRSKSESSKIQANALACGYTKSVVSRVDAKNSKYFWKTVYGDRMTTPGSTCLLTDVAYTVSVEGAQKAGEGCPVAGVESGTYALKRSELLIGDVAGCDLTPVGQQETTKYTSQEGCSVTKKFRPSGTQFTVYRNPSSVNFSDVAYLNDYSSGNFAYCLDRKTNISHIQNESGTEITISCDEHKNRDYTMRGKVEVYLAKDGEPVSIKMDGQRKGWFGWKQEVAVECRNLVKNGD
jgi:hypothetical protein